MIDFFKPYLGVLGAIFIIAALLGLFVGGFKVGSGHVQAAWDKERSTNATAAIKAVDQRIDENEIEREKNRENNRLIQQAHDAELDRVRSAVSNDPRLRSGAGICGEPTRTTEADSASGGDGANSGGRLVREDVGRDLDALKISVEEAFAAGRACQQFLLRNGMAP